MKRAVVLLLVTVLIFGMTSVSAESKLITLEDFSDKYNEGSEYVTSLLMVPYVRIYPSMGPLSFDESPMTFTLDIEIAKVTGEAFYDTGVISRLEVLVKRAEGMVDISQGLKIMALLYAISDIDNFTSSMMDGTLEKMFNSVGNASKSVLNGYDVAIAEIPGTGQWAAKMEFVYKGKQPTTDMVPNARDAVGYLSFFLDKIVDQAQEVSDQLGAQIEAGIHVLKSGEYIVGQHIPAGEYSASTDAISVNLSTRRAGKLRINELLTPANPIGRMVLQDGDEIEISGGAVTFSPLK